MGFSRSFRSHGCIPQNTFLHTYKIYDYVDIKVNSSIHKGMPHKLYQGRTGMVWNIGKRALGVEVLKQVRGLKLKKRINLRIEHLQPSRCREDFFERIKQIEKLKTFMLESKTTLAKEKFDASRLIELEEHKISTKRMPLGPAFASTILSVKVNFVTQTPYDFMKELTK